MAAAPSKIDELLLNQLECPVCLEWMMPPITLCENGHNICNSCKPDLRCCPTCRGSLGSTRCITLEKLVEELQYPCINKKHGCEATFPATLITSHQSLCEFSPYACPAEGCKWKGAAAEMAAHVEESHDHVLHAHNHEDLKVIDNYHTDFVNKDIIIAYDQVFVSTVSSIDGVWHFLLELVGPISAAVHYEYTVTFSGDREKGTIKVTHLAHSVKEDVKDIYKSCQCVKLPLDVVQRYLMEHDLLYYLQITML